MHQMIRIHAWPANTIQIGLREVARRERHQRLCSSVGMRRTARDVDDRKTGARAKCLPKQATARRAVILQTARIGWIVADSVTDGLPGEQRFFISSAQNWREKYREPAIRRAVPTDDHAPLSIEPGVTKEDRKDLLGHKSRDVTTDYSAAELMSLVKSANLIIRSKDSPTLTVLRVAA